MPDPAEAHGHPDGRVTPFRSGMVAEILVDRPAKLNGFTPKMIRELAHAMTEADGDPAVRVMLLHAAGPHFTAGLDLAKVAEAWDRCEEVYPQDLLDIWNLRPPLRSKPLVVAVKGVCFTVGVELLLSADIVVAADNCRFSQLEVRRGIMASGGATIRMIQRAGWGNAMRYLLTGDEWDAQTALRLNFIQEIVPAGTELARARELATTIAECGAPLAVQATMANARHALDHGAEAAAVQFDAIRTRLRATQDAKEGLLSFVERRRPAFTGTEDRP